MSKKKAEWRQSMNFQESIVEDAALAWFGEPGYSVDYGPQLVPGEPVAERDSLGEVSVAGVKSRLEAVT